MVEITCWHWVGFIACVLVFLTLDLGVFHRHAHTVKFREALAWSVLWVTLSLAFAGLLSGLRGREEAVEFVTGYIIELSLSMDNVFVIALIFAYFRVPAAYQHPSINTAHCIRHFLPAPCVQARYYFMG